MPYIIFLFILLFLASCSEGKQKQGFVQNNKKISFVEYKQKLRDSAISKDFELKFKIRDSESDTILFDCFIVNHSGLPVYLPYSLDGSSWKWRYPFVIENLFVDGLEFDCNFGRCGNMNDLRKNDFKLLQDGDSIEIHKYFPITHGIAKKGEESRCRPNGKYKINIVYSTRSDSFAFWLGDSRWYYHGLDPKTMQKDTTGWAKKYQDRWHKIKPEFDAIMDSMPRITLSSDTVYFELK